ncbi:paired amphipathic helix protein Sin3b-like [Schistocerca cancellata]|uniref:paired amphipathic helix protein Sin3b-like n=1 Tax=Schistocerca cancellata TaxID=274614 RepID=UPI002119ABC4|nr:paired amphipathic helix protein Sin3b-like [Schistocerca cancellata]
MKRRAEDTVKQEQAQVGVYCGQPRSRASGSGFVMGDSAPSALATHSSARILSSLSGNGAVSSYTSGPPKATERNENLTGNIQYSSTSYSANIPGSCVSTAVKVHGCLSTSASPVVSSTVTSTAHQFQRLKVEDALSYLDQVKFKFGNQPQVYNDFLDIMKEFKSQSIDTPGVIQRVSNLFKGHPELIVGFNTFLPPGYKIEVQSSDQGHSFQVSVSMPSPSSVTAVPTHVAAGMVTHHLSIPANLNTSVAAGAIPATATQSSPVATGVVKPIHSPTHHSAAAVASASAVYHNVASVTAAATSIPAVASTPSPSPMVPHHHIAPSTSPVPAAAGYTSPAHSISHADHCMPQGQGQPVEFNHAINYVNKIKNRFQGQPDKYKKFLEILHTYQKEQRNMKEGHLPPGKHLTEAEVYSQVAKLFEHQDDLLAEFGQFLPDATSHQAALGARLSSGEHSTVLKRSSGPKPGYSSNSCSGRDSSLSALDQRAGMGSSKFGHSSGQIKRTSSLSSSVSGSGVSGTQSKKHKLATLRDITITEAGKYSTLSDFAFFDKVRKALKNTEAYENFLRCLTLFNNEIVSSSELIQLVTPFLGKFPELFKWFKRFMGRSGNLYQLPSSSHNNASENSHSNGHHPDRMIESLEEIDYTTCKRLGASYCALPKNYRQPKCSGRTPLCKEVLNDTWVSFPSWSEDSTFVTSRKTQYEEFIYRCEDERFELDLVIETNTSTIRVLEGVNKKMSRMSHEELVRFKLDDCLGGSSPTIHLRAVRRLYGDKAPDIIEGLKKNPTVAVPVVLRRLKSKEEEWREAQKGFNKVWREQNEKYYLKSLDHQGINFKQNDLKALRSKSLFNDIEVIFDERHEQAEETTVDVSTGPHLILPYKNKCILDDTANLLIHHVKRQTGIHKEEKHQIKLLLRQLVPDMFFHPRQELSEDEREEDEKTDGSKENTSSNADQSCRNISSEDLNDQEVPDIKKSDVNLPHHAKSSHPGESYTLFYANNYWYLFLRLHQILCERLTRMYERARFLAAEECMYRRDRRESTAVALRLKPKSEIEVEDYYPAFLDMIKNVLDGNMDNSTFEDHLREMFGIFGYLSFTIDKVIVSAVRQLQFLVTDETCRECIDLYHQEKKHGGAGGDCKTAYLRIPAEQSYQRKAEKLLLKENCFKVVIYKHDCQLTIELLDTEENSRSEAEPDEKWPAFGEGYSASAADGVGGSQTSATVTASEIRDRDDDRMDLSAEDNDELESEIGSAQRRKPVFLPRNVRMWRQRSGHLGMLTDYSEDIMGDRKYICELEDKQEIDENQEDSERKNSESSSDEEEDEEEDEEDEEEEDTNVVSSTNQEEETLMNATEVRAADSTFCNFNINQYRMVFVVNQENYLYRRKAFHRAHQLHSSISLRLGLKFRRWHVSWVAANVSESQHRACEDWLMGRGESFVPNTTHVVTVNDVNSPPYRSYSRYRVERLSAPSGSSEE